MEETLWKYGEEAVNLNYKGMGKYVIMFLLVLKSFVSVAQEGTIDFIFPDKIEHTLDSCLQKLETGTNKYKFYFLIEKDVESYSVTIAKYTSKEEQNLLKWVRQTNRFAVINKRTIPLIFDYDLKLGAIDGNRGEFGDRDDNVKRVKLLLHGPSVYFNSDGNIIKIVQ